MPDLKYLIRAKNVPVEGYVWCDTHGDVHEDTLDPYEYGYPSCLTEVGPGVKKEDVHRKLLVRRVKGDLDESD